MGKKVLFCLTSLKVRKVQKSRADTVNLKHSSKSFWRSAGQPASVWLGYRGRLTANAFSGCHGYTDKSMHQWSENTNALTQSHALLLLQLCSLISGQRKLVDTFPFSSVLLTVLTHEEQIVITLVSSGCQPSPTCWKLSQLPDIHLFNSLNKQDSIYISYPSS